MADEYIRKQRAKDLMGCCLASAKANYKEETDVFKKAKFQCYVETIEAMIDVVGSVESADVQPVKWISVNDRLPENNKLVLCYAHSTTGEGNSYFLGAVAHGEFWFLKVNDIGHVSCPVLHWEVTHWQPLPESPKDGEQNV